MLELADPTRCQAEIKEGSFMTLGPRKYVRCKNLPTVIVGETKVTNADGEMGEMSLCESCFEMFKKLNKIEDFLVRPVVEPSFEAPLV